ncbi:holocytochrome c synthase CYC3 [Sugiyamaella lignohabitans]|uniref:Holocytochrome c-type synthase n=1 Tax=Sugiyamaella lignohabitans TaxID=796027 RepID=A0A167FPT2_9ASCO|nr:holocytochrome c synthase CYC3 [Sugiyamaella lignohabitans]ANB15548.1 holocytochrome c synthase CYC3 [Sugiyamaella lignohabitans]
MGWFWADSSASVQPVAAVPECPVDHGKFTSQFAKPEGGDGAKCPVDHSKFTKKFTEKNAEEAKCPVDHSKFAKVAGGSGSGAPASSSSTSTNSASGGSWWWPFGSIGGVSTGSSDINPLNNMPDLSSQRAPGQKLALPTERTMSSIPKGTANGDGVWEYPSPQQMLNAMIRKGGGEIPEDAVESMVDVHNFLNEEAWEEILKWEEPYTKKSTVSPRLLKFTGRPDDMSPRAQMLQMLGKVFPAKYGTQPPFDRHDWTVLRASSTKDQQQQDWQQVRYVIDYYAGPDTDDGMPTFILDVRPALDSVSSAVDRFDKVTDGILAKAMGWEK